MHCVQAMRPKNTSQACATFTVFLRLFLSTHHIQIGKVWIYRLLFVCLFVCLFVWLRISPPRIKLAASKFSWRFIGVQGRESQILVNSAASEAQNRMNWRARGPRSPARVDVGSACVNICQCPPLTDFSIFPIVHHTRKHRRVAVKLAG